MTEDEIKAFRDKLVRHAETCVKRKTTVLERKPANKV